MHNIAIGGPQSQSEFFEES